MNVHSLEFHSGNQKLKIIQLKKIIDKCKDQGKILIFSLFTSQNLLRFYPQNKMNKLALVDRLNGKYGFLSLC